MLKEWSVNEVVLLVRRISKETKSPYRNTASQWECKKDLYHLLWAVEDALDSSTTFDQEADFLQSYEHHKTLAAIKGTDHVSR
jgi:hypothetical protein